MSKIKCRFCGEKIDSNLKKCPHCGISKTAKIVYRCPECKEIFNEDLEICPNCGAKSEIPDDVKYDEVQVPELTPKQIEKQNEEFERINGKNFSDSIIALIFSATIIGFILSICVLKKEQYETAAKKIARISLIISIIASIIKIIYFIYANA